MPRGKAIGSSVTLVAVEDPETYDIFLSQSSVKFNIGTGDIDPTSIVATAKKMAPNNGTQDMVVKWGIKQGNSSTITYVSSMSSTLTLGESALKGYTYPVTLMTFRDNNHTQQLKEVQIQRIDVDPTITPVVLFEPSLQLYDADSSGKALSTEDYPVLFSLQIGNTVVTPSGTPTITFEGGTTTGASIPSQPGSSGCSVRITANYSPRCNMKVILQGSLNGVTYSAVGYLPIAPLKQGATGGSVGSLGKMYYYAGVYASTKTYSLTATQAPYVLYNNNFFMLDNAANSGAAINVRNVTPADGGNPWTQMASEMKYYIAEAMFANFAKLGSAIFNQDYQLSQYGSFLGYGGTEYPITSSSYYQYADENNMLGVIDTYLHRSTGISTVSNGSYDEEITRCSVSLASYTEKRYMLEIQCDADTNRQVEIKLTKSYDYWDEYVYAVISDSDRHVYQFSVPDAGTYKLYYKQHGVVTSNPKITYSMVSECAFRPNMFVDYLQGLLYSNKGVFDEGTFRKGTFTDMTAVRGTFTDMQAIRGYFNDIIVEGKVNNLITVIDWENGIGRDKIIKAYYDSNGEFVGYTQGTSGINLRYYIDVLNCGDYVWIKSLPSIGTATPYTYYRLPFFGVHGVVGLEDRGHTRDLDGNPHQMTAEEMYKLVGRRITIRTSTQSYYNCITGLLSLDPVDNANTTNVANGRHYYYYQSGNASNYQKSIHLIPQVVHIECQAAVWSTLPNQVNYWGYGYVWVGCDGIGTDGAGHPDEIAQYWT